MVDEPKGVFHLEFDDVHYVIELGVSGYRVTEVMEDVPLVIERSFRTLGGALVEALSRAGVLYRLRRLAEHN